MVPSCAIRELYRLTKKKKKNYDGEIVNLSTLSVLLVRIALEYSKIHEKAYQFIVCEFGGFQMYVMRASAPSLHRESTDSLIYTNS